MSFRRFLQCTAMAAGTMMGCSAMAQYAVSLETTGTCNNTGTLTVAVKLSGAPMSSAAAGAQLFLSFDSGLTATSITTGPGLQTIFNSFNNGTQTVNLAIGVTAPAQVISAGDTIATITFSTGMSSYCNATGLVSFRSNVPPSTLTDNSANSLTFTTSNLGAITINDTTAPVINGGSPLASITASNDSGQCSANVAVSAPSATDNCGTPSISGSRSDAALLTDPYPVGTTVITWTATDGCGNNAVATQSVVVSDTQAPSIVCGSTVTASNDLNQCGAMLSVTAPTVGDNCPGVGSPIASLSPGGPAIGFPYSFPVGSTTLYWRVTDAHSNTSTCTQTVTVNDTQAPSVSAPSNITQNADAGGCTLTLNSLGTAGVSDNCPGAGAASAFYDNGYTMPVTFPAVFSGTTSIYWRAFDAAGNPGFATQTVTVNAFNTVSASIAFNGADAGTVTRCVTLGFYNGSCPTAAYTTSQNVTFTNGTGTVSFDVPCGATYSGITAIDSKHTLRETGTISIAGPNYSVDFTGSNALRGGNVNADQFIDILDFGGYIGQFGTSPGGSTACGYAGLHADFSGNGNVGLEDFSFIQSQFLAVRDADPCLAPIMGGPRNDVSVADLVTMGLRSYAKADRNLDGRVNAADVQMVMINGLSTCAADFNGDTSATVQDLFDFLSAWFSSHPRGDFNNSGTNSVQDLFDFINAWFVGC